MKLRKILVGILLAAFCVSILASCSSNGEAVQLMSFNVEDTYSSDIEGVAMTIYVDCNATTVGDGSKSAPYQTVAEAQAKISEMKQSESGLPVGGVRVLLSSGTYSPVGITEENCGTAESPIYYVSEE